MRVSHILLGAHRKRVHSNLKQSVQTLAASLKNLKVRTYGLVNDFPLLLQRADLAVLRAGALSISESLAAGTPVIAFDWHVHERGNMEMLLEHKCGWGSKDPKKIVEKIEHLCEDPALLHQWSKGAADLASCLPGDDFADILLSEV